LNRQSATGILGFQRPPETSVLFNTVRWRHVKERAVKVRAVVFDLGYTLWDVAYSGETAAYVRVRRRLVEALGETVPDAQTLRNAVAAVFLRETREWLSEGKLEQLPTEEVFRQGFAGLGLNVPEALLGRMGDWILGAGIRYTVDPETAAVLRALKERGLRLGAVSNTYQSRASLRRRLSEHGLLRYLDALVISSEVGLAKPHPAIFQAALEKLGVAASEAVFVGDMVWADVLGAQALGMRAVLTHQYRQDDPGESRPELVINRLAEVVEYVDRLNSEDA
jgi:HAD superfamily hydrolase (TIGR01509 family)